MKRLISTLLSGWFFVLVLGPGSYCIKQNPCVLNKDLQQKTYGPFNTWNDCDCIWNLELTGFAHAEDLSTGCFGYDVPGQVSDFAGCNK